MKKRIFHFYADPAHGWLKVNKKQLVDLGIQEKVSRYSYQNGEWAYLEEDLDAGIFISALKSQGVEVTLKRHHSERSSRIRNYQSYNSNRGG